MEDGFPHKTQHNQCPFSLYGVPKNYTSPSQRLVQTLLLMSSERRRIPSSRICMQSGKTLDVRNLRTESLRKVTTGHPSMLRCVIGFVGTLTKFRYQRNHAIARNKTKQVGGTMAHRDALLFHTTLPHACKPPTDLTRRHTYFPALSLHIATSSAFHKKRGKFGVRHSVAWLPSDAVAGCVRDVKFSVSARRCRARSRNG